MYRKFLRHTIGLQAENTVDELKELLGVDRLELVMVDSVDELMTRIAEEGIPYARKTKPTEPEPQP